MHTFASIRHRTIAGIMAACCLLFMLLTACSNTPANSGQGPITIGASLSTSGDFASDGAAFTQGYHLWANAVNAHGGLLGRTVQLILLPDDSSVSAVTANYEKLILQDHVDMLLGPFSTKLSIAASVVANQYGYAMVEGAGGGPSVFNRGLYNIFDVSLPVANNLVSFTKWLLSLPATNRLRTVVYASEDDPFTQPQVDLAQQLLTKGGMKALIPAVIYPANTTDFTQLAAKLAATKADVVILGTVFDDAVAFMQRFNQLHYHPKVMIETAGPDQGTQFLNAIGGTTAAQGVMVPNSWFPNEATPGNAALVQAYIATYGGTADAISADVPEAYSVGQVVQQAITTSGSLDQAKLIQTIHTVDFTTVQGPVRFDSSGQNIQIQSFLFQWQQGSLVPIFPADTLGAKPPEMP